MANKVTQIPNHLLEEKSPYLLQHAYNPVHWFPWGSDAFEKAKKEDKPVFLSIGYSTCHWCHVMAHESFEDEEVAQLLNNYFVCIKVDREERPDIDSVYMSVCQAMTGQGGWPLTVFMTPEQTPFYCATYIPKHPKYGSQGMMELLPEISRLWKENRHTLMEQGEAVREYLNQQRTLSAKKEPTIDLLKTAAAQFKRGFDPVNGGFNRAPKFPSPHNLLFLLQYGTLEQDQDVIAMVEKTLEQMYRGGMFDHIGGGFSRYSTDEKWLVPHFEKMLYDNALLAYSYLEAYHLSNKNLYKLVAERVLEYVKRELLDEKGGFYCGQDADSDGIEGKFYVFTLDEIKKFLGRQESKEFIKWYTMTKEGNFEGKFIPNLLENPDFHEYPSSISQINDELYSYRKSRTNLHKDDKVLTSWNSLMIVAFAKAYRILGKQSYYELAQKAQTFIADSLSDEHGRLKLRWRKGQAVGHGILDDYAFYCWGLLELYQCHYDVTYLAMAVKTATDIITFFHDEKSEGYFLYASDSEQLISRPKELYDGAMPSGNGIAAQVFVLLAQLTGETHWEDIAYQQLCFLAGNISDYPTGYTASLSAMSKVLYPGKQLVCVIEGECAPEEILNVFRDPLFQNVSIIIKTPTNTKQLSKLCPFTDNYPLETGRTAFYLCQNQICTAPVYSIKELMKLLGSV